METTPQDLYLELMKRCILGLIVEDRPVATMDAKGFLQYFLRLRPGYNRELRELGRDWPSSAHSMIGLKRMENLQFCVETVIRDSVPGDFIETGVWRGGAGIFMRAILKAYDVTDRRVWMADSFQGLPAPNAKKYPLDKWFRLNRIRFLKVSQDDVKENFRRYDLLDDQVRFLQGWFSETLPDAPIDTLSVLRLDGDLYESTMDALSNLYHKLSPGGFVIVDDYALKPCKQAVHDFREQHGITDAISDIDGIGAYWRRSASPSA